MLNPIDEIKNRLNIVEVIGSYIKLQKTGQNFRAPCPFHPEKTPSFFVSPSRQIWHCFGCSKGGNIFQFIMDIEGVEFGDALRLLAQKAGVELKRQDPKIKSEREHLYEICELTTKFFEKQLKESNVGKEAKKYLLDRKIGEDSLKKWRLGYAPDVWQGLSDFLNSKGYQKQEIEKAGLGLSSEQGSFYDRFRGRIIFPIFDLNSKVVGFTGRVFKNKDKSETAKYVNTPQTLLYDKGRVLYGLDKAKIEIRRKNACILVEGNTDLIMAHQSGFENTVAISGTALTSFQLNILKRYSDNLLIAFDMDVAGQAAAKRGIDMAQSQGFDIKMVIISDGKDPAEVISKNPEKWKKALEDAKTILDFYFETAFSGKDSKNPSVKKEIAKILLPVIKRIPNKIEQAHWVQELAKKLGVKEADIEEEINKISVITSVLEEPEEKSLVGVVKSRREMIEERIITLILKSPQQINCLDKKLASSFSGLAQTVLINLQKAERSEGGNEFKKNFAFSLSFVPPKESLEIETLIGRLSLEAEMEEIEEKDILPEIQFCLREIQLLDIKNKLDKISKDIKKAEGEKDSKKIEKLTKEFNELTKEIT